MRPIEIYCFIAQVCPQWASPRLWLVSRAESWPLIGQCCPCLVTVTVVMCPVSRMSRGHKHYCHDKSQNSDTGDKTCRKHPLWEFGRNDSGLIQSEQRNCFKLKYFLIILSQHPLCDIWWQSVKWVLISNILTTDFIDRREGWWWCEACNEKLPTHVIIPSSANRPD